MLRERALHLAGQRLAKDRFAGKEQALEPLAKLWVDEWQSHFECNFRLEQGAWWFHAPQFQPEIAPEWGSQSPLMSFASGSLVTLQSGAAFIIADVQNDFLPGGALAVPEGNQVASPLNRCIALFTSNKLPIFATRDWHPANHCSFKSQGGPWPPHCVAGTNGAAFANELNLPDEITIVSKADTQDKEAYSGFQETGLHDHLRSLGIRRLFIGGLTTDYCVLNTAMDALNLGYRVMLLIDAIRALNLKPHDGERAIAEMESAGAHVIQPGKLA
ncbi:MAG: nicotinamidase [Mariprofundaceae bacterium]|nr:nicotinamidase [Mariprofundaceae bacterium]